MDEAQAVDYEEQVEEQANTAEADELQDIRDAFKEAVEDPSKDEDDVKLAMIAAGATFKNVTRLYNKFAEEEGLIVPKEQKQSLAEDAINSYDVTTEEGFNDAVNYIVENSDGKISTRSAAGLVRGAARKREIEFYKKPKSEGTGTRRHGFTKKFHDFLAENPHATAEEVHAFIEEHGSENTKRWESSYQKVRDLVNRVAASVGA